MAKRRYPAREKITTQQITTIKTKSRMVKRRYPAREKRTTQQIEAITRRCPARKKRDRCWGVGRADSCSRRRGNGPLWTLVRGFVFGVCFLGSTWVLPSFWPRFPPRQFNTLRCALFFMGPRSCFGSSIRDSEAGKYPMFLPAFCLAERGGHARGFDAAKKYKERRVEPWESIFVARIMRATATGNSIDWYVFESTRGMAERKGRERVFEGATDYIVHQGG